MQISSPLRLCFLASCEASPDRRHPAATAEKAWHANPPCGQVASQADLASLHELCAHGHGALQADVPLEGRDQSRCLVSFRVHMLIKALMLNRASSFISVSEPHASNKFWRRDESICCESTADVGSTPREQNSSEGESPEAPAGELHRC